MPRPCGICGRKDREAIERGYLEGPHRAVAARYGIAPSRLRLHMKSHAAQFVAAREQGTLAQVCGRINDLEAIKEAALKKGYTRVAVASIQAERPYLELKAKLQNELNDRVQHNAPHLHLPPERALQVAETYTARHGTLGKQPNVPAESADTKEVASGSPPTIRVIEGEQ